MSVEERIRLLVDQGLLDADEAVALQKGSPLTPRVADRMVENVIGVFGLPFAIAPNFLVNGRDYIVPMVVEEPSVVAGVSSAAKVVRDSGGFTVTSTDPILIGQIQVVDIPDPDAAIQSLVAARKSLVDEANELQPNLLARGGGARDIECHSFSLPGGEVMVVLHLLVDTRDAMGANLVNTMCEGLAARIEKLSGGKVVLRILSNLVDRSLVTAQATIALATLETGKFSPEQIRDAIVLANDFANIDPYRAATHNKGIMNGIDAVAIATGNDWRAVEAGAHAFAAAAGAYRSLTAWSVTASGDLRGELTIPLKVGIVGGSLSTNPAARAGLRIAGVTSASELGELMAATGLAQNFAALRALTSSGIQRGHMRLHARSVAAAAGVPDAIFDRVVGQLVGSGEIKTWKAEQLAAEFADEERRPLEGAATGKACGKVILLGEHAVVYGRHALALPLPDAVTAEVAPRDREVRLSAPGWGIETAWSPGEPAADGAGAVVALIMDTLGIGDKGYDIQVTSSIPLGMGLGSSAAFAVAVIRAFIQLLGTRYSDIDTDRLAFRCEKLTHGTPSGVDNNIATFGAPVLFTAGRQMRTRQLELGKLPPLVIASSGTQRVTSELVAAVRARFETNEHLYTAIFDKIDEISISGAEALEAGDYRRLGTLMNVCQGLLNAIGVSTPQLESMIDVARRAGAAGAKLTGAGGGGSIVALSPGKVGEVAAALEAAGYEIVLMESRDS